MKPSPREAGILKSLEDIVSAAFGALFAKPREIILTAHSWHPRWWPHDDGNSPDIPES